jgi:hypothetical protein
VEDDKCPKNTTEELLVRCQYLLLERRFNRAELIKKVQSRIRSTGLVQGILIRRGVELGSNYRSSLTTTVSLVKQRIKYGFRPRPKTVQEAEGLQDAIVLEGDDDDCQKKSKDCEVVEEEEE